MATWNSRGLRGSTLEDMINKTLEKYREKKLCLIQKIPTPITPINIDQTNRHITLAYFDQKSTVDYIGVVQGIPVCFDAKECAVDTFALSNVHAHQYQFMQEYETQSGIAFLILFYSGKDKFYYMPFEELKHFWSRMEEGGRKSIRFDELSADHFISPKEGVLVPFLDNLKRDYESRLDN